MDLHLAGFDLGEVEDVVDHPKEHPAAVLDVRGVLALLLRELIVAGEHFGEPDDAVERGPELVAHRGQEVALDPVHLIEGHVGLGKLVDLQVEVTIHVAKLLLHGDEVVEHPVEGVGKLLELVAGLDAGPNVEPAGGDGV